MRIIGMTVFTVGLFFLLKPIYVRIRHHMLEDTDLEGFYI